MSLCGLEQWTPGASPGERLRQTWQSGRCGTVQIAHADVVRLPTSLARMVLELLTAWDAPLGPVLDNRTRSTVEFTVCAGTAMTWPSLPFTLCVHDAVVRCPAPAVTEGSGRWVGGRRWISKPTEPPGGIPVTDADTLLSAVVLAFPRWRQWRIDGADSTPSGPGGRP